MNVLNEFYSYFMKPSVVAKCKKGKHLLKLDLSEKNLPKKLLFIALKAYVNCSLCLQKKLPLENDTLYFLYFYFFILYFSKNTFLSNNVTVKSL